MRLTSNSPLSFPSTRGRHHSGSEAPHWSPHAVQLHHGLLADGCGGFSEGCTNAEKGTDGCWIPQSQYHRLSEVIIWRKNTMCFPGSCTSIGIGYWTVLRTRAGQLFPLVTNICILTSVFLKKKIYLRSLTGKNLSLPCLYKIMTMCWVRSFLHSVPGHNTDLCDTQDWTKWQGWQAKNKSSFAKSFTAYGRPPSPPNT